MSNVTSSYTSVLVLFDESLRTSQTLTLWTLVQAKNSTLDLVFVSRQSTLTIGYHHVYVIHLKWFDDEESAYVSFGKFLRCRKFLLGTFDNFSKLLYGSNQSSCYCREERHRVVEMYM